MKRHDKTSAVSTSPVTRARALAAACMMAAAGAAGAQTFSHYLGLHNASYDAKGMQRTAEYEYYYYVDEDENAIELDLPIKGWDSNENGSLEPWGYFRWYNYTTDRASANLSAATPHTTWWYTNRPASSTELKAMSDANGENRGLVAWNLTYRPHVNGVGVQYNPPAGAGDEDWEGETIACDVSRYTDVNATGTSASPGTFEHEPTLQIRYIFHIQSAKKLARQIMDAVNTDKQVEGSDRAFEDHKKIFIGLKDNSAQFTLRVNYNDAGRYFFYPMTGTNKHVFTSDDTKKITSSDFNTSRLCQATTIKWRVYDDTMTKYRDITSSASNTRFLVLTKSTLAGNNNDWKTLTGTWAATPTISNSTFYNVVAYASNGTYSCPIAAYRLSFSGYYPMTNAEIRTSGQTERLLSNLESRYSETITPISLDADNDELTPLAPTSYDDNMSRLPSDFGKRSFGFVYRELGDRQSTKYARSGVWYGATHAPNHGDYGLYKSANVSGVSGTGYGTGGYLWYDGGTLYDRTYEMTSGKQYGYFLYIDGADESRKIATAKFSASLCAGTRMVFYAGVANMTSGETPQVMFKLYGVIKDENDVTIERKLVQSFSSGDFNTNRESNNKATWYQVFGTTVLDDESGVDNFEDFELELDNMCQGTDGADYAIDDIRLYTLASKVDMIQENPVCPSNVSAEGAIDKVKFKVRGYFETIHYLMGSKAGKVRYRLCSEDGTPVKLDYNGNGSADEYGEVDVPAAYSATATLGDKDYNHLQFEVDQYGDIYVIFAYREFPLQAGKKYYLSFSYPDEYGVYGEWGSPSDVCSLYSNSFEAVRQSVVISDTNGNVLTEAEMECGDDNIKSLDINASISTVDKTHGGTIVISGVNFDWFISEPDKANDFNSIEGLREAYERFRDAYPNATSLQYRTSGNYTRADYNLLRQNLASNGGRLIIKNTAKLSASDYSFTAGSYELCALPVQSEVEVNGVTYEICTEPLMVNFKIIKRGPKITFGFPKVPYTDVEAQRIIRLGLPQVETLKQTGGMLKIPVYNIEGQIDKTNPTLTFSGTYVNSDVVISNTNDPTLDVSESPVIAKVQHQTMTKSDQTLDIKFVDDAATTLHEGYWYECMITFRDNEDDTRYTVYCPGESYFTIKVVPEYVTWNSSTVNSLNSNWNNDANWLRSTAAELYNKEYADYGEATYGNTVNETLKREAAYVPMKFTKVTVADQTGKVYPCLDYITYRLSDGIATKLTNSKTDKPTDDIQYDLMVTWNKNSAYSNHTDDGANLTCEAFYGNTCDEIYFKPGAELLEQCFLVYNRAHAEKELSKNGWYIMSSPLKDTYAGDLYVPVSNGRQETKAFDEISFVETQNSRSAYPIYQRNWDGDGTEVAEGKTYNAYDYDGTDTKLDTATDDSLKVKSLYWSHVYNDVTVKYDGGKGFAIKVGDDYKANDAALSLIRLPKKDTSYSYYNFYGNKSQTAAGTVKKDSIYRMVVNYQPASGSVGTMTMPLDDNIHSDNGYYILGNPYTATLSMYQFLKGNRQFEPKVWTLENGNVVAAQVDLTGTYNKATDFMIAPMQAFFVKLASGAEKTAATFTSPMTVDRWTTGSTTRNTSRAVLSLEVSGSNARSRALVNLSDGADDAFVESEDVEVLRNDCLGDAPAIYTVASDQTVAVNTRSTLDWLPLGVISEKSETLTLTVSKTRSLTSDIYIYDSETGKYTAMNTADSVTIAANEHGRYFITTSIADKAADKTSEVVCYSPAPGLITVTAQPDVMGAVSVYSVDGRKVAQDDAEGEASCNIQVPAGVYVVKTMVDGGSLSVQSKVNVK